MQRGFYQEVDLTGMHEPSNAFVPMSSSVNVAVRDALVTQHSHTKNGERMNETSSHRPTSKGEFRMRSRYSKRFADDKNKRSRTTFNTAQINALEIIFEEQQYPDQSLREKIAERLGMEEHKIVIWFQNRRAKYKRNNRTDCHSGKVYDRTDVSGMERRQRGEFGESFKRRGMHHLNPNGMYNNFQQNTFQDNTIHSSYHSGIVTRSVVSSTQKQHAYKSIDGNNDAVRNAYRDMDGFNSSPDQVSSSVDVEEVTSCLKPDKPLVQEPPPNQICTNAGSQDEMRQALNQWRARQNMASSQPPNHSTIFNSISSNVSSSVPCNVPPTNKPTLQSQSCDIICDDTYFSSSSSSEDEEERYPTSKQGNTQFTHNHFQTAQRQFPTSISKESRTFSHVPVLNPSNQLYLDIPSVSSGDISSPAPHSTTSTASWPSSSELSSIDPLSPTQISSASQLEQEMPRCNIPPTFSDTCAAPTMNHPYAPHSYANDSQPLAKQNELLQNSVRLVKRRKIRQQDERQEYLKMSQQNINQYHPYPQNMNFRQVNKSKERMFAEDFFIPGDFNSYPDGGNVRAPFESSTPTSFHIGNEQQHFKRQHADNRQQNPETIKYHQMKSQNGTTTNGQSENARQQYVDRNGNLNGCRFGDFYSTPPRDAPDYMVKQKSINNSSNFPKPLDQQQNGNGYIQQPDWMQVHVPIPPRRQKHPQPMREETGATSGVVHHYGNDLDVPSVSDLSHSLDADQSATLNHVLESVVKDIFPFSDNFISI